MGAAFKIRVIAVVAVVAVLGYARAAPAVERVEPGGDLYFRLDRGDIELAHMAVQEALEKRPSDSPQPWANDASGNAGVVTPLTTFKTSTGYYCRRFRETVVSRLHGEASGLRTACRDDDGVWRRVEF